MLVERNGTAPQVDPTARVAPTATLVGHVVIGPECVVDHGAVLTSSGPPVVLDAGVVVMPNAVVRSVGGAHRPAFDVRIGAASLVGPAAVLAGCRLGRAVYVATQVMVFHGADVGDGCRLGAGSVVHTGARLPARTRVGLRQLAVPTTGAALVTGDLDQARAVLAAADFFGRAFELEEPDQVRLHEEATAVLRREAADFDDRPLPPVTEPG